MNDSPLVHAIQERLRRAGYSDLSTPFKVAGVEFEFTGAMRGRDGRALDLVLLVDTTTGDFGDRNAGRVRQRIEALSRALDVTGSRYVVTAILAGAVLTDGIEALSETCRVLQVEDIPLDANERPENQASERRLDDRIRVLLPLTLPETVTTSQDGSGQILERFYQHMPATMALFDGVLAASEQGEEAVTDAAALAIGAAFLANADEDAS